MNKYAKILACAAVTINFLTNTWMTAIAAESGRLLVLHVKTALSVDDAQICVAPNVAWAASDHRV